MKWKNGTPIYSPELIFLIDDGQIEFSIYKTPNGQLIKNIIRHRLTPHRGEND